MVLKSGKNCLLFHMKTSENLITFKDIKNDIAVILHAIVSHARIDLDWFCLNISSHLPSAC